LSEDRQIISSTERDPLTGLYNRDYFYRYAEQYDLYHKDTEMDAIVIDINRFRMINERFGNAYGDEVLRKIAKCIRELVAESGGIVCRRSADTFMVYCPHGRDYRKLFEEVSKELSSDETTGRNVRLRMGIYEKADKTLDIERRFDRAKMAADRVRGSFARPIGVYDISMHEKELYNEQLIDGFAKAIEEEQFTVYYQPKFDVRNEVPFLTSAEALVRWIHPEHGMISPGVFIPLFENNGLIQRLDHYVWRMAARQIRDWKDRLGFSVPVSVNMSRIDMYDPDLIKVLGSILDETGLDPSDFFLEITESAYTQDSGQIIDTVSELRSMGFRIEMDDFGTGYSSLNMISSLPIDALKLDMQFIRNAFREGSNTKMIEIIIDIADYLDVPVIAEGVETEEQMLRLREMGCDIVQGYFFSRPVPAAEYEIFLKDRT
ncbi:MAG: bifunctional diguanylate cyclase/phosphodiesterase, partial [Mogibacterium sp.]|nr:bifunctional diguanylate cyclase/phosphodiesterase [Mogibacterium sp.]